jgi:hypothetical protein
MPLPLNGEEFKAYIANEDTVIVRNLSDWEAATKSADSPLIGVTTPNVKNRTFSCRRFQFSRPTEILDRLNSIHDTQDSAQSFIGKMVWPTMTILGITLPEPSSIVKLIVSPGEYLAPHRSATRAARNAELLSPVSS